MALAEDVLPKERHGLRPGPGVGCFEHSPAPFVFDPEVQDELLPQVLEWGEDSSTAY